MSQPIVYTLKLEDAASVALQGIAQSAQTAHAALKKTEQGASSAASAAAKLAALQANLSRADKGKALFESEQAIAGLQEMQRELRLTGQYSAEAAAAIDRSMSMVRQKLAEAATEAARTRQSVASVAAPSSAVVGAMDSVGASATKAGAGMSALKSGLNGMVQQLPDVGAQLAVGANPLIVLAQQGLQVVQTTHGLGEALSSLAGPLSIAAIAAAALVTVYAVYANRAEQAAEASGRVVARVKEATSAVNASYQAVLAAAGSWAEFGRSVDRASEDLAVLTGTADKYDVQAKRQIKTLEDQARAGILADSKRVVSLNQAIAANNAFIKSGEASALEITKLQEQNKKLAAEEKKAAASVREKQAALEEGRQIIQDSAEYSRELAAEEDRLAAARGRSATASDLAAERERLLAELRQIALRALSDEERAVVELEAQIAELSKEMERLSVSGQVATDALKQLGAELNTARVAVQLVEARAEMELLGRTASKSASAFSLLEDQIGRLVPSRALTSLDTLRLAEIDLDAAIRNQMVTMSQAEELTNRLADARRRLAVDAVLGGISTASGVLTGGAGAAITAGLGIAGAGAPAVAAAQGVVSVLGASAEGDLADNFLKSFQTMGDGLVNLPDQIGRILEGVLGSLPEVLSEGLPAFTSALVGAVPALIGALVDPRLWVDLVQALARGVLGAIGAVLRGVAEGMGRLLSGDFWRDVARSFVDALLDMLRIFNREDEPKGGKSGGSSSNLDKGRGGSAAAPTSAPSRSRGGGQTVVNISGSFLGTTRELERSMSTAKRRGGRF